MQSDDGERWMVSGPVFEGTYERAIDTNGNALDEGSERGSGWQCLEAIVKANPRFVCVLCVCVLCVCVSDVCVCV